jgi:hypothetical protein
LAQKGTFPRDKSKFVCYTIRILLWEVCAVTYYRMLKDALRGADR